MCRCCQNCWEDLYWNCFEEKFCYDESIANYNPETDEEYLASQKNGSALGRIQPSSDNNNLLTVPGPICNQPMRRNQSALSIGKIHEEDYRRETQTNVPTLGPEILAVFANSQIFQDHPKLNRISTKSYLAGVHSPQAAIKDISHTTPRESEQDRLIRRLEGAKNDTLDSATPKQPKESSPETTSPDKRIKFTLTTDSSPEGSQIISPNSKFQVIAEEDNETDSTKSIKSQAEADKDDAEAEVILRPRLIDRHPHLLPHGMSTPKKTLRSVKSVPHFNVRSAASETDIFAITGSGNRISMTPEVPSISFSNLPKNYEDTPTIEKYRVSQSLYSISMENAARATRDDYSMPRYFRSSAMLATQSTDALNVSSTSASATSSREDIRKPEKEKSKRLQKIRGNLPPLLIHSVSFSRKNRDEGKQAD